ncbi:MAG: indolepyruvate ferredoxin oxidoreductase [Chloroflexota bacterium]|nr:MAG: indolepyruvate ferredoxin oxidoreductase [Chloroflexota bacterium]
MGNEASVGKITIASDAPEHLELLLGNAAIARGLIEGGLSVAAAYPGTPSTEILENLAKVAEKAGLYVEWSTNEKVAVEVAAAASMSGLRAVTAMKAQGLNVAMDFVMHVNLTGTGKGGLVLIVCDDPAGHSSGNEQDSRWVVRAGDFPLLEPTSAQEAKDMAKYALSLSEELGALIFIRSVTRISHSSSDVVFGDKEQVARIPEFDTSTGFSPTPVNKTHVTAKQKLEKARSIFDSSPFNAYVGPKTPKLTIICSGTGYQYSRDALTVLDNPDSVAILKLGTTWPLPTGFLVQHLDPDSEILVIEEVDPHIETALKNWLYDAKPGGVLPKVHGKSTGHIPAVGEMNPDIVAIAVAKILGISFQPREAEYDERAQQFLATLCLERELVYCPGCPHRASFLHIKNLLRLDGNDGFVAGDIGCYSLDRRTGGQRVSKTLFAMGSGVGVASGFGKLGRFGYRQPVFAACGDSTFFHAAIPAVINAVHNNSDVIIVVLDNSATAMTGFQSHPGLPAGATAGSAVSVSIEDICRSLGCAVEVADPYDTKDAREKLWRLGQLKGPKIMIMRRKCGLIAFREDGATYRVWVDQGQCLGESCGCNRYCTRIFKCPALVWDKEVGKAVIDKAMCTGCGFCVNICPENAIQREAL